MLGDVSWHVHSLLRNAISVSGIPVGWGGSIFLGESQSHIYPNMCAKFGCGPTVGSEKKGTDRQSDTAALYSRLAESVEICSSSSRLMMHSKPVISYTCNKFGYNV